MFNVPNNQGAVGEEFKEILLNYKKSLNLFKKHYNSVYTDDSLSMGQISVSVETFKRCEKLLKLIDNILRGKQTITFKIPSNMLNFHYDTVSFRIKNVIDEILNAPNGVIQQIPRPTSSLKDFECEVLELPKINLLIKSSTIKKLNGIALTIDKVYDIFKKYGFDI